MLSGQRRLLFVAGCVALISSSFGGFIFLLFLVPGLARSFATFFAFIIVLLVVRLGITLMKRGLSGY